jgi:hypothetical protein
VLRFGATGRRTVAARLAHHEALSLATAPGGALNPGECRGEMRRAGMWRGGAFRDARCSVREAGDDQTALSLICAFDMTNQFDSSVFPVQNKIGLFRGVFNERS